MKIHHYTSIESLAMILSSRKIRFTRLDRFDDVQEAQRLAGVDFGRQFFASCWSCAKEEQIPQWAMYGDQMRGIRLSLPADPFDWTLIDINKKGEQGGSARVNKVLAPFSEMEMFGDGYILIPPLEKVDFASMVEYVPDVAKKYRESVRVEQDKVTIIGSQWRLGRQKLESWKFQEEFRFLLIARSGPCGYSWKNTPEYLCALSKHMKSVDILGKHGVSSVEHIALQLSPHALDDAEIVVGPLASQGSHLIVTCLANEFAPKAVVRKSELSGSIQQRK